MNKEKEFISVEELRANFERIAILAGFDIERTATASGLKAYSRDTLLFWSGYWSAARDYGIISPNENGLTGTGK